MTDNARLDGLAHVISDEFQKDAKAITERWDKEWMRYFSLGKDYSFYYYIMDTPNYALSVTPSQIAKFSPKEVYDTHFYKKVGGGVWAYGSDIVGKNVLEIGCGPGIFGRMSSRFTLGYTGIDASQFALYIARLTSPATCLYIHLYDPDALAGLAKSSDFTFGRNFFIHHNYEDSLWLLKFLRDLTKDEGIILADFFSDEDSLDGDRRIRASAELNNQHPSALYSFSDDDIYRISKDTGLVCEAIDYVPDKQYRFARLRVKSV